MFRQKRDLFMCLFLCFVFSSGQLQIFVNNQLLTNFGREMLWRIKKKTGPKYSHFKSYIILMSRVYRFILENEVASNRLNECEWKEEKTNNNANTQTFIRIERQRRGVRCQSRIYVNVKKFRCKKKKQQQYLYTRYSNGLSNEWKQIHVTHMRND